MLKNKKDAAREDAEKFEQIKSEISDNLVKKREEENKLMNDVELLKNEVSKLEEKKFEIEDNIAEFIGWVISEGHERKNRIVINQKDKKVVDRLCEIVKDNYIYFEIEPKIDYREDRDIYIFSINSETFKDYLVNDLGYKWGKLSGEKEIPTSIEQCNESALKAFTVAYFDGDGCCNKDNIELSSKSEKVIDSFRYILRRSGVFGVKSFKWVETERWGSQKYWRLNVGGMYARLYDKKIGFGYNYKQTVLDGLCSKDCNTNIGYSVPCIDLYNELLSYTGLSLRRIEINASCYLNGSQYPSKDHAMNVVRAVREIINNGLEPLDNPRWKKRREKSIEACKKNKNELIRIADRIEFLADSDLIWLRVKEIKRVDREEWVYDLSIADGSHNYYTDLALGHNTIQAIATAIYRKNKGEIDKCLIITPASLKWNWPLEIEKFTNESYSVIAGTPEKREKQ